MKPPRKVSELIRAVKEDARVIAVFLFGSYARGERAYRDVDVCLVLGEKLSQLEMSRIRLAYLARFPDLDIHVFQQLPIYIRARVLKEGKLVYCSDEDRMYELAFRVIKEYEDFRPLYEEYLRGVANG